jgi:hypothetical protein
MMRPGAMRQGGRPSAPQGCRRRGRCVHPDDVQARPGYQFAWSHEDVEIAGKPMRAKRRRRPSGPGRLPCGAEAFAKIKKIVDPRPRKDIADSGVAFPDGKAIRFAKG